MMYICSPLCNSLPCATYWELCVQGAMLGFVLLKIISSISCDTVKRLYFEFFAVLGSCLSGAKGYFVIRVTFSVETNGKCYILYVPIVSHEQYLG